MRWCAVSPTTSKRSGWRATTSSVLVPTDPVEPRMHSRCRFMASISKGDERQREREHRQQRIDAIEHAAMAWQQLARVLGARGALDERFEEVAYDAHAGEGDQRQCSGDHAEALH